jgi:hypothetical protein
MASVGPVGRAGTGMGPAALTQRPYRPTTHLTFAFPGNLKPSHDLNLNPVALSNQVSPAAADKPVFSNCRQTTDLFGDYLDRQTDRQTDGRTAGRKGPLIMQGA